MSGNVGASTQGVWWKDGTFYQIWPASYKDANGDGIGDIKGIISTLDYLKDLGVDVIWVSPMFKSPQKDMGYDISDYEDIDPQYGTLKDAELLIEECHKRGMRLLFDLVINHTSDQHAWFQESRSSKDNPKRDWYIWRPARIVDGKREPPNNWRSYFGGSAWEWDETTEEYYLHLFVAGQPDLNWENPTTRNAVYDSAVTFWLEKGLDGFRIDTVNLYSKEEDLPDAQVRDYTQEFQASEKRSLVCNCANVPSWDMIIGPMVHGCMNTCKNSMQRHYPNTIAVQVSSPVQIMVALYAFVPSVDIS